MGDEVVGDVGGFTAVTERSYFDRMQDAFAGVCIGILLFFGSGGLLFWNEGRSVKRQADLDEGRGIVKQVGMMKIGDIISKSRDTDLVYITGLVDAGDHVIYDDGFNLNVTAATNAIKYERSVEMYQWQERSNTKTEKTSSGGTRTVTTYSYHKIWSSRLIRSSRFKERVTPSNPTSFLVPNYMEASNDIGLGPFRVSKDISEQIDWDTTWRDAPIDTSASNFQSFPGYTATFSHGILRLQRSRGWDSIGDNRITFSVVLPDYISVVAKQGSSGTLEPYITTGDRELLLFGRGIKTSDELFDQAEQNNVILTWVLRFAGLLVMIIGISLILNPIATAFDVLPFCGDTIVGAIGGCLIPFVAFSISLPLSLLIVSIAWIFYRPLIAVASFLMLAVLVSLYILYFRPKISSKPQEQSNATAEDPEKQEFDEKMEAPEAAVVKPSRVRALKVGQLQEDCAEELPPFSQALKNPPPSSHGVVYTPP